MRGQAVTFNTETRDCCEGLEPQGLTCSGCDRHFHVGTELLQAEDREIHCPSCGGVCFISGIAGETKDPATEAIVEIVCGEAKPEVADRIRAIAKTKKTADPSFWSNVMMRESWYVEHGSYAEWDEAALAAGQDPTIYSAAPGPPLSVEFEVGQRIRNKGGGELGAVTGYQEPGVPLVQLDGVDHGPIPYRDSDLEPRPE